jgi:hypothetical protein
MVIDLSAQLAARFSRTVTISQGLQTTVTRSLTNTREGYLRRVAVWHMVHSIALNRVAYTSEPRLPRPEDRYRWIRMQEIEFADAGSSQTTFLTSLQTPGRVGLVELRECPGRGVDVRS